VEVLAYLRVSTAEQGRSGLGVDAQRAAISQEAERRGWTVVEWIQDEASGKSLRRPGIQRALERLENGGPKILVAAKLDRIARSALDFLGLVQRAEENGWQLIILDPAVDMTDPMGRFTAGILAQVAQLERELIGQRTREALQAARERGVVLGRPPSVSDLVRERIIEERKSGRSLRAIADGLNRDAVPTAHGGARWHASTIRSITMTVAASARASTPTALWGSHRAAPGD
jgi:DNA invertase Pin-like site-specific DNA recombinase